MKSIVLVCLLLTFGQGVIRAQTADDYVAQGRAFLTGTNIVAANNSFSNAVGVLPAHQTANALYAVTRLLVLPSQPAGSNFLSRLGMPATGRDIYHWTARMPSDTNGIPIAPAGVSAGEATALLRTNILQAVIAAEANLAAVTDTNFILSLSAGETRTVAVTVDYGDLQMMRALLQAAGYFIYTTYAWNLDAQLTVIRSLYSDRSSSLAGFFNAHPQLLAFASTNDLAAAQIAFVNGAGRYLTASQLIRNRPLGEVRLFNYDAGSAKDETNFRLTISDLASSLTNGILPLQVNSNYSVFLPSQFDGQHSLRSFLPRFHDRGFVVGTLPDATFGGLVSGIRGDDVEKLLAGMLTPIPDIFQPPAVSNQTVHFPIHGLNGRGYVIQTSSNLLNWSDDSAFISFGGTHVFSDTNVPGLPRRFYRVMDRTTSMPPPANDNFVNRIPLSGLGITTTGYDVNATTQPGEPGYGFPSVWWSWTAPTTGLVLVGTVGSPNYAFVNVYTGTLLGSLTAVPPANVANSYNGFAFVAAAGATYQIQVAGFYGQLGAVQLEIGVPPVLSVTSPVNGLVANAPTNITISASAVAGSGRLTALQFSVDGGLIASTTNTSLSVTITNFPPGFHSIQETATDDLGLTVTAAQSITIRPANDNFANAIALPAAPVRAAGSNAGATKQVGEPDHGGYPGGSSVWWSWTAPSNEVVNLTAGITTPWGSPPNTLLAVYEGTSVTALSDDASTIGSPALLSFFATAGVNYKFAVDGEYGAYGNIDLSLWVPYPVSITAPTNGAEFYGPTNVTFSADVEAPPAAIKAVRFYDYNTGDFIGAVTSSPYSLTWSNLAAGSYYVAAEAVDTLNNSSFSDPVYFQVKHPETTLALNVPVSNRAGLTGAQAFYKVMVPPGAASLTISIAGGTGDCDLYVAYGYQPGLYYYDYGSASSGNYQTVTIPNPQPGDWHIMLYGFNTYAGVTLLAQ